MKVYSISRWTFYGICLLILILPVSRYWELLLRGKTATGRVLEYEGHLMKHRIGEDEMEMASTIEFQSEGDTYITRGPWNYEYREGRTVRVRYDPKDPQRNCILTLSGFYLDNYSTFPLILIIVWGAFYLSYNNYHKKKRSRRVGTPASSPSRPSRQHEGHEGLRKELPGSIRERFRKSSRGNI
ncbi:MAG: DUF3592 domain-containing protein [Bacteroidales bacterium]